MLFMSYSRSSDEKLIGNANRKSKKQKVDLMLTLEMPEALSPSSSPQDTSQSYNSQLETNITNSKDISSENSSIEVIPKDPASDNPKLSDALQNLQIQTDCPIVQNKWHRKFGPPTSWTKPNPSKGSEIFVGKIPRDLFEDELVPVLQKAGAVYEIRLMMEMTGLNRGFAYVKFSTKIEAERAITLLNGYEIRPHHYLGVMKSVDNNRLFIGGIPKSRKQDELLEEIKRLTDDVLSVILYSDVNDKTKNRGFAFVEYKNHTAAYSARQKLMKNPPLLWGTTLVKVDWAEPEREVDEQTMNKVRILYVRNLALDTTDQQLRDLFCTFGGIVERVKKIKDYAFVHFSTREEAEEAKDKLQGYVLDNCDLDICWSKPVTNRDEYQQRKAASKALSSASSAGCPLAQIGTGINGEPIIINQRVRTAAGAQGYITPRPYPARPLRQNESDGFVTNGPPFVYSNMAYVQELSARTTIGSMGVPPPSFVQERAPPPVPEEYITHTTDGHYHLAPPAPTVLQRFPPLSSPVALSPPATLPPHPYNVVPSTPNWHIQAPPSAIQSSAFLQAATQPLMSPYVFQPGSYVPIQGSAFAPTQPLYYGQVIAQLPGLAGANIAIERS